MTIPFEPINNGIPLEDVSGHLVQIFVDTETGVFHGIRNNVNIDGKKICQHTIHRCLEGILNVDNPNDYTNFELPEKLFEAMIKSLAEHNKK